LVKRKGRRRPLVSDASIAELASPAVLEDLIRAMPIAVEPALQAVRNTRDVVLYRLPTAATRWLASFTPGQPDEFYSDLDLPAERCVGIPTTQGYEFGGLQLVVLRMRGAALEAASLANGSVYYWWWPYSPEGS